MSWSFERQRRWSACRTGCDKVDCYYRASELSDAFVFVDSSGKELEIDWEARELESFEKNCGEIRRAALADVWSGDTDIGRAGARVHDEPTQSQETAGRARRPSETTFPRPEDNRDVYSQENYVSTRSKINLGPNPNVAVSPQQMRGSTPSPQRKRRRRLRDQAKGVCVPGSPAHKNGSGRGGHRVGGASKRLSAGRGPAPSERRGVAHRRGEARSARAAAYSTRPTPAPHAQPPSERPSQEIGLTRLTLPSIHELQLSLGDELHILNSVDANSFFSRSRNPACPIDGEKPAPPSASSKDVPNADWHLLDPWEDVYGAEMFGSWKGFDG